MGVMISQLKISPLEFEKCWNAGVLTTETVKVVKDSIEDVGRAIKGAASGVSVTEDGGNVTSFIDQNGIAEQIRLGDIFDGS